MIGSIDGGSLVLGNQSVAGWHKRIAAEFQDPRRWECEWRTPPSVILDPNNLKASTPIRVFSLAWTPSPAAFAWLDARYEDASYYAYTTVKDDYSGPEEVHDDNEAAEPRILRKCCACHPLNVRIIHRWGPAATDASTKALWEKASAIDRQAGSVRLSFELNYGMAGYRDVNARHPDILTNQDFDIVLKIPYLSGRGRVFPYVAPATQEWRESHTTDGVMYPIGGAPMFFAASIRVTISSHRGFEIWDDEPAAFSSVADRRLNNNYRADH